MLEIGVEAWRRGDTGCECRMGLYVELGSVILDGDAWYVSLADVVERMDC